MTATQMNQSGGREEEEGERERHWVSVYVLCVRESGGVLPEVSPEVSPEVHGAIHKDHLAWIVHTMYIPPGDWNV